MKRCVWLAGFVVFVVLGCTKSPERPPATLAELEKVTAGKSAHEIATYLF